MTELKVWRIDQYEGRKSKDEKPLRFLAKE